MTTVSPTIESELKPYEAYVPGSHWRNAEDEAEAAKLGMWLFLGTEVLMFGGFFCAYAVYRMLYPGVWHEASRHYLSWEIGAINTAVLLLSSFTIVMAIRGAQLARMWQMVVNIIITIACALFFLVVKLRFEYWPKYQKGELPGANYNYVPHGDVVVSGLDPVMTLASTDAGANILATAAPVAEAAGHAAHAFTPGTHDHLFLSIYWIATATHGLHVLVGVFVLVWALTKALRWHYGPNHYTSLENIGLYWHLVDVIWIFLFPLLYLV